MSATDCQGLVGQAEQQLDRRCNEHFVPQPTHTPTGLYPHVLEIRGTCCAGKCRNLTRSLWGSPLFTRPRLKSAGLVSFWVAGLKICGRHFKLGLYPSYLEKCGMTARCGDVDIAHLKGTPGALRVTKEPR